MAATNSYTISDAFGNGVKSSSSGGNGVSRSAVGNGVSNNSAGGNGVSSSAGVNVVNAVLVRMVMTIVL